MISLKRKKYGVSIDEIYFASSPKSIGSDAAILFFVQAGERVDGMRPFRTSIIDLSRDEDTIMKDLSSNTTYKIRRARREGFVPEMNEAPAASDLDWYADYFDEFSRQKGFSLCNRTKLAALNNEGALVITRVSGRDGNVAAAHAWVCDKQLRRVRLLYSASHFRELTESGDRNAVGRANRLLHWFEILQFKASGYIHYDLGGLPIDSLDAERNSIARFKLEFGGKEVIEYTGLVPGNRFGKMLLRLNAKSL